MRTESCVNGIKVFMPSVQTPQVRSWLERFGRPLPNRAQWRFVTLTRWSAAEWWPEVKRPVHQERSPDADWGEPVGPTLNAKAEDKADHSWPVNTLYAKSQYEQGARDDA